jgi:multiple sugar transport system substrate-binding protein
MKKDNIEKGLYFEGPYWEGLFDANTKYLGAGDLLALPVNFVFSIYYYNKNMLAKAGVKEPDYNWKWEDLLSMAQKLTVDKNGKTPTEAGFDKANVAQYGYFMEWNDYDWSISAGGRWMTPENKPVINSPENVKGYQFLADMIQKHNVMPTKKTGPEIGLFPTGKNIAIYKAGSWNYTTWRTQLKDFDWDVAPVPIGPLGKRVAYGGSNQFGSWKGVKNPDASWVVVKTLAAPDMTLKHWGSQGIPSVKSSAASADWPKIANYSERMAKISSEAGGYIQSTDPNIRSSEWKAALSKELDLVWEGSAQVPDALKKAQDQVEKIMARPSA